MQKMYFNLWSIKCAVIKTETIRYEILTILKLYYFILKSIFAKGKGVKCIDKLKKNWVQFTRY